MTFFSTKAEILCTFSRKWDPLVSAQIGGIHGLLKSSNRGTWQCYQTGVTGTQGQKWDVIFSFLSNQRSGRTDQSQRDNSQIGNETKISSGTLFELQRGITTFLTILGRTDLFSLTFLLQEKNVQNVSVTKIKRFLFDCIFFSAKFAMRSRGQRKKTTGKVVNFSSLLQRPHKREKEREKLESRSPCTWRTSHQRS